MTLLATLFYFLIALLLLVTIHEFGHFIVARLCGVKVLRFSFGFGKVLASWHDRRGTEFAWSLLPLGGYVKMLDESEGEVKEEERHLAFNNQSLGSRALIVLAGPVFNFLFAFAALWIVLVIGTQSFAPIIQKAKPGSAFAKAGLVGRQEIVSINGTKVANWRDVQYAIMPLVGTTDPMTITVKSVTNAAISSVNLPSIDWQLDAKQPDILDNLGIIPFVPTLPMIVGDVMAESPAFSAGIHQGDLIRSVNNHRMKDWLSLVDFVKHHPNQRVVMTIIRQGQQKNITVLIGAKNVNGHLEGSLGVRSQRLDWPKQWIRTQREPVLHAMFVASSQTMRLIGDTFVFIGHMLQAKVSTHNLSGPVGIAQAAGESARHGLTEYLYFLALLSISLGVLNLLPIPALDGGYLLYYLIEFVVRRPLSEKIKSTGAFFGFFCMIALMIVALSNDINRLLNFG